MANVSQAFTTDKKHNLSMLVGEPVTITDAADKEHVLPPYCLADIIDLRKLGPDWFKRSLFLDERLYLLWLSMRHEGKTRDQFASGERACKEADVRVMFDAPPERIHEVIQAVIVASDYLVNMAFTGTVDGKEKENPTAPPKEGGKS